MDNTIREGANGAGALATSDLFQAAGIGGATVATPHKRLASKRRLARFYLTSDRLDFWRMCGAFSGDPRRNVLWQRMLLTLDEARAHRPSAEGS